MVDERVRERHTIESLADLWRFTSGWSERGCVPGGDYLVLRSCHGNYVMQDDTALKNWSDRVAHACKLSVTWLGVGVVTLSTRDDTTRVELDGFRVRHYLNPEGVHRTFDNQILCDTPLNVVNDISPSEKWEVLVEGDGIVLSNVGTNMNMSAETTRHQWRVIGATNWGSLEVFHGWKLGAKSDWLVHDKEVEVARLDNTRASGNRQLRQTYKVGISHHEELTTARLEEGCEIALGAELATGFSAEIISTIDFDWSIAHEHTWLVERTSQAYTMNVEAGRIGRIVQVVGYFGPKVIRANHFREIHENSDGSICRECSVAMDTSSSRVEKNACVDLKYNTYRVS